MGAGDRVRCVGRSCSPRHASAHRTRCVVEEKVSRGREWVVVVRWWRGGGWKMSRGRRATLPHRVRRARRPPQTALGHGRVPTCGLRGCCPGHRQAALTKSERVRALGSNEWMGRRERARSRMSASREEGPRSPSRINGLWSRPRSIGRICNDRGTERQQDGLNPRHPDRLSFFSSVRGPLTAKDAPSSGISVNVLSPPPLLYVCSSVEGERKSSRKTRK